MTSMPVKAVKAIANPAPLTLAQLALFEKIDAPILHADTTSLRDNLIAIWIYKTPTREVAKHFEEREIRAIEMSEKMSGEEYGNALIELIEAVTAFYEMLPKKEAGEEQGGDAGEEQAEGQGKKTLRGSATDGLPNSVSGYVAFIITHPIMCLILALRFVSHFFTVATRKA